MRVIAGRRNLCDEQWLYKRKMKNREKNVAEGKEERRNESTPCGDGDFIVFGSCDWLFECTCVVARSRSRRARSAGSGSTSPTTLMTVPLPSLL